MGYVDDPYEGASFSNRPGGNRPPQGQPRRKADGPDDDYVEVKERIQQFYATYPTGALRTVGVEVLSVGQPPVPYALVRAEAYRTPDDPHPGTGTSWMPIPGTTPYTRASEIENCETSAWGRAIACIGILVDKGIASASEIRSKQGPEPPSIAPSAALRAQLVPEANGATETPVAPVAVAEAVPAPAEAAPVKEEATEPDPAALEAAAILTDTQPGLSLEEFRRLAKEKNILTGGLRIAAAAAGYGPVPTKADEVAQFFASLTDIDRLTVLMAAQTQTA